MNQINELLLNAKFYPYKEEYKGCIPYRNNYLGDCEDGEDIEILFTSGDCELPYPSISGFQFMLGDCGESSE